MYPSVTFRFRHGSNLAEKLNAEDNKSKVIKQALQQYYNAGPTTDPEIPAVWQSVNRKLSGVSTNINQIAYAFNRSSKKNVEHLPPVESLLELNKQVSNIISELERLTIESAV
ncbi:MAG: hypothetical protein COA94_03270 [Rickettsiales bacterium]|nr:MAG: hypothetical protein COA94_03270 [Rickettsiales bacterium]